MRIAALSVSALLLLFGGCASTGGVDSPYVKPNSLMAEEIESRVQQIPYQHRDELLQNLMWLAQTGETTIPTLLRGLGSQDPKVRSSCAWVLGRIHDRRAIPQLEASMKDLNETVRLEVARTLVGMGDLQPASTLIEGLDSDRKEVRYLCHEALKTATGRDFGYDHLSENETQRRTAVLGWRQWWSEFSGDKFFATTYQEKYHLGQTPATPMVESQDQQSQTQQTNGNVDGQGQGTNGQGQGQGQTNQGQTNQGQTGQGQNGQGTGVTPPTPQGGTGSSGTGGTGNTGTGNSGTGNSGTGNSGTGGTPPTPNPTPTPQGGTNGNGNGGNGTNGTGSNGTGTNGTGTNGNGGNR
jgi:hypothetical protein